MPDLTTFQIQSLTSAVPGAWTPQLPRTTTLADDGLREAVVRGFVVPRPPKGDGEPTVESQAPDAEPDPVEPNDPTPLFPNDPTPLLPKDTGPLLPNDPTPDAEPKPNENEPGFTMTMNSVAQALATANEQASESLLDKYIEYATEAMAMANDYKSCTSSMGHDSDIQCSTFLQFNNHAVGVTPTAPAPTTTSTQKLPPSRDAGVQQRVPNKMQLLALSPLVMLLLQQATAI
ncbi:hypothetical protein C0993_005956 [Termitomyces sp. T159_Od127]|nr:hypothetical protein C0993_005956 [Termitomyces sp. T159_Od127]